MENGKPKFDGNPSKLIDAKLIITVTITLVYLIVRFLVWQ